LLGELSARSAEEEIFLLDGFLRLAVFLRAAWLTDLVKKDG